MTTKSVASERGGGGGGQGGQVPPTFEVGGHRPPLFKLRDVTHRLHTDVGN